MVFAHRYFCNVYAYATLTPPGRLAYTNTKSRLETLQKILPHAYVQNPLSSPRSTNHKIVRKSWFLHVFQTNSLVKAEVRKLQNRRKIIVLFRFLWIISVKNVSFRSQIGKYLPSAGPPPASTIFAYAILTQEFGFQLWEKIGRSEAGSVAELFKRNKFVGILVTLPRILA